MSPFVETNNVALGLLVAALCAGLLAEIGVTVYQRLAEARLEQTTPSARQRAAVGALLEAATAWTGDDASADRGTKQILIASTAGAVVAAWAAARHAPGLAFPGNPWLYVGAGILLICLGFALRAWAIATLGRFFRRVVIVQHAQTVVTSGPYRFVRHPAYAGNLLSAIGLGLALTNWLSLAILAVVPLAGHLPRIRVEEAELERRLGEPYRRYATTTARLVPGVW